MGYFVAAKNIDGEPCDGFGRMLDVMPPALGYVLPQWAGMVWFVLDCLVVMFSIIGIDNLIIRGKNFLRGEP